MSERERRLIFGEVAEAYHRARPAYPDALIDDVVAFAGGAAVRALEVGAGTGKATAAMGARGVTIEALEPSPQMAAVLRREMAEWPSVSVVESSFEAWRMEPEAFDLVYSAQAWHWVTPQRRFELVAEALRSGGALALFWNRLARDDSPIRRELDAIYTRVAPEMDGGVTHGPRNDEHEPDGWLQELDAVGGFPPPEMREYPWDQHFSTAGYLEYLSTHSNHRLLAPSARGRLFAEIGRLVDANGGAFTVHHVADVWLTRRR